MNNYEQREADARYVGQLRSELGELKEKVQALTKERDDYEYTLRRYSNPAHWHVSLPPRVECRDVWALDCAGYAPAKETLDKYATTAPA